MREDRKVPKEFLDWCEETRKRKEEEARELAKKDMLDRFKYMTIPFILGVTAFPYIFDWLDRIFKNVNGFLLFFISLSAFYVLCLLVFELVLSTFNCIKNGIKKFRLSEAKESNSLWNKMEELAVLFWSARNAPFWFAFLAIILVTLFALFPVPRYTMQAIGNGRAYQHDRWTGKTYLVAGAVRIEIKDEK